MPNWRWIVLLLDNLIDLTLWQHTIIDYDVVIGKRHVIGEFHIVGIGATEHYAIQSFDTLFQRLGIMRGGIATQTCRFSIYIHIKSWQVVIHLVSDVMPVAVLIEILVVEIRVGLCVTQLAKTACTAIICEFTIIHIACKSTTAGDIKHMRIIFSVILIWIRSLIRISCNIEHWRLVISQSTIDCYISIYPESYCHLSCGLYSSYTVMARKRIILTQYYTHIVWRAISVIDICIRDILEIMSENSILHDILFLIDNLAILDAKSADQIVFHIFIIWFVCDIVFFFTVLYIFFCCRIYIDSIITIFECQLSQFTVIEVNGGIILALILYALWSEGSFMDFKQGAGIGIWKLELKRKLRALSYFKLIQHIEISRVMGATVVDYLTCNGLCTGEDISQCHWWYSRCALHLSI